MPEFSEADVLAEVQRLTAKQATIEDEDIRLAVQAKIDALEGEIAKHKRAESALEAVAPEPEEVQQATPEQLERADGLIRQSKVEKMRGNGARALALMKEAADVAPTSPAVLEALGDDFADRRQFKEAKETYRRAMQLAKGNVGLETKYAMTCLRVGKSMSIEEQMNMSLSDSMFVSSSDQVAGLAWARILNALFPGLGHMVLGRTATGIGFMAIFIVSIALIAILHKDFEKLVQFAFGHGSKPTLVVLLPIFLAIVVYIASIASLGSGAQRQSARQRIDHPLPPVDLPFE